MLGQVAGNTRDERMSEIKRGIDDGDIINKRGLYWWKSEIESEVTQKTEQVTLTRKGTIKDKSDRNAIESALASFSEAKMVADGKRGVSSSGVSEVPSKFGWDTLQSCRDSCENLLRDMMAKVAEIRKSSNPSRAQTALAEAAVGSIKQLKVHVSLFDSILLGSIASNDLKIKQALQESEAAYKVGRQNNITHHHPVSPDAPPPPHPPPPSSPSLSSASFASLSVL
eukprot:5387096-Pyramimonas_sp.AAC.1